MKDSSRTFGNVLDVLPLGHTLLPKQDRQHPAETQSLNDEACRNHTYDTDYSKAAGKLHTNISLGFYTSPHLFLIECFDTRAAIHREHGGQLDQHDLWPVSKSFSAHYARIILYLPCLK